MGPGGCKLKLVLGDCEFKLGPGAVSLNWGLVPVNLSWVLGDLLKFKASKLKFARSVLKLGLWVSLSLPGLCLSWCPGRSEIKASKT